MPLFQVRTSAVFRSSTLWLLLSLTFCRFYKFDHMPVLEVRSFVFFYMFSLIPSLPIWPYAFFTISTICLFCKFDLKLLFQLRPYATSTNSTCCSFKEMAYCTTKHKGKLFINIFLTILQIPRYSFL